MHDPVGLLLLGTVAFLLAGTIKGMVGLGLPPTAIGVMTLFIAPRTAIVLVLFPMILTNAWQVWRMGDIRAALMRYLPFALTLAVGVGLTSVLAASASDRLIYAILGGVIVLFVLVNLALRVPPLPERWDLAAQIGLGCVAGVMGGMTAVWAPPMAIYLTARQVDKDEFVRVTGLLIFLGSLPLAWGFVYSGQLTSELGFISLALVLPAMAGFAVGERLRNAMDQALFRKVFLWIFLALGLNLIRRAIFG